MTPEFKIKQALLKQAFYNSDIERPTVEWWAMTDADVSAIFTVANEDDALWEYLAEFREGTVETGLPAPSSSHYESKEVAAQMLDGSWVGWTYWFGGGRHGEPETVEWMNCAYDLDCSTEEKLVVVQTFTKKEVAA